jgi:hypothetical protein
VSFRAHREKSFFAPMTVYSNGTTTNVSLMLLFSFHCTNEANT